MRSLPSLQMQNMSGLQHCVAYYSTSNELVGSLVAKAPRHTASDHNMVLGPDYEALRTVGCLPTTTGLTIDAGYGHQSGVRCGYASADSIHGAMGT